MRTLLCTFLLFFLWNSTVQAQHASKEDTEFMTSIVEQGLERTPDFFFKKGKDYDYASNLEVLEIIIPEDHGYSNKGGSACHFYIELHYKLEGEENTSKYRIMGRQDSTGKIAFYGAYLR